MAGGGAQEDHREQWVFAEEREDGAQWPLLFVTTEREAIDIVRSLRALGRNVCAVSADPNNNNEPL
jgi:hypothetical protein